MVDNTSAVGNDSRPWVVPQSIKWLPTITMARRIPPDSESGGIPHLFGTSLSPHIGSAWRARHDNNNNKMMVDAGLLVWYIECVIVCVQRPDCHVWNTQDLWWYVPASLVERHLQNYLPHFWQHETSRISVWGNDNWNISAFVIYMHQLGEGWRMCQSKTTFKDFMFCVELSYYSLSW